ncbi:MAG TPA: hypothetical protein VI704_01210 [Bacteroidota bacterium]|nr:hypothetical protein [Bacteroidota bacterium]
MDSMTNPVKFKLGAVSNVAPKDISEMPTACQEKLALLRELDAAMKMRYHQSLDDVLRDLYVHNVISKPDLNADEIVRTFETINILKNETDSILRRFRQ